MDRARSCCHGGCTPSVRPVVLVAAVVRVVVVVVVPFGAAFAVLVVMVVVCAGARIKGHGRKRVFLKTCQLYSIIM